MTWRLPGAPGGGAAGGGALPPLGPSSGDVIEENAGEVRPGLGVEEFREDDDDGSKLELVARVCFFMFENLCWFVNGGSVRIC